MLRKNEKRNAIREKMVIKRKKRVSRVNNTHQSLSNDTMVVKTTE
jgi:hypothetical protein